MDVVTAAGIEVEKRFAEALRVDAPAACFDCGAPYVSGYRTVDGTRQWLCWKHMLDHVYYLGLRMSEK